MNLEIKGCGVDVGKVQTHQNKFNKHN